MSLKTQTDCESNLDKVFTKKLFLALLGILLIIPLFVLLLQGLEGKIATHIVTFSGGMYVSVLALFLVRRNEKSTDRIIATQHSQLMDAVEALDEGFLLFDKDRKIVVANSKVNELFSGMGASIETGADRVTLTEAARQWFNDADQIGKLDQHLRALKENRESPRGYILWDLPNGKKVSVTERYTLDKGVIATFRDVTDEHKNQGEIKEKSELLSKVFESMPIGICVYDKQKRIIDWNQNYIDLMDVKENTIFHGIHMQQHLEANFDAYLNVGETPEEFATSVIKRHQDNTQNKIDRKTKSGRIVEVQRASLGDGGFIGTFTEVTLTRTAQSLLEESELRHREMVELSPDAILSQKDGLIIYANDAAVRLFRARDMHQLIGKPVRKFFPFKDHENLKDHFGPADAFKAGHRISPVSSQVLLGFEKNVDVEIEATAMLYGERPVIQLIIRDISAMKNAEEILLKAKEEAEYVSQLKGTFLANMSHELRTPLNAVIGFSEIIKNEIFGKIGSKKYVEYASDIHSSGIHLLDLINDILDLSKVESGRQKLIEGEINPAVLVEECVRLTAPQQEKARIKVETTLLDAGCAVYADQKMLKQVMINLLSNAIKFTPQGGKVDISSSFQIDGSLAITVTDTGIGLKAEDIPKALTPFVQVDSELSRKYNGTGLGLPLSKNLMELHNGTLGIESQVGEGTSVTITLPKERIVLSAA